MGICAGNAYSRTLKLYHGWVVRGVFAVRIVSSMVCCVRFVLEGRGHLKRLMWSFCHVTLEGRRNCKRD